MDTNEKGKIVESLKAYCVRFSSDGGIKDKGQNKASNSLKNVSSATISQMINGKWDLIKDEMWRNVSTQIGHTSQLWIMANTGVTEMMNTILVDSKKNYLVNAIIGNEGTGKTAFLKMFQKTENSFLVRCSEYWNKKEFMREVMLSIGKDSSGLNINEMMRESISYLKKLDHPILEIDEFDKVSDNLLYFFITLYNELEDHCSIIITAAPYFKKRIERGVLLNKKGFREIWSRMGKKFLELPGVTADDINEICIVNGIYDSNVIHEIISDSESDIRRVKKKVLAYKRDMIAA